MMSTACEKNNDRVEQVKQASTPAPAELFLTPMESQGLQYMTSYAKDVASSADLLARVKKVMESYLFDPTSAQFRNVKAGRDGSACGSYNAKNRYGAYVGFKDFVLTSDNRIVASDTNGGIAASSNAEFIDAYLDACGTKAQIAAFRSLPETPTPTVSSEPAPDQEPDRVLDAPSPKPPVRADIPTT